MSFLKPKPATSTSENLNRGLITDTYTPQAQSGVAANSTLAGALGVPGGDAAGATAGFNQYQANSGFQNVLQSLVKGMTGGAAAGGLLRSGPTARGILREGTALNQQSYNNYLQQLQGLSGLGLQGGGLISNAGQTSSSNAGGPSTAGTIASAIGGIASIFSDRRLKKDIRKVGKTDKGLPIYTFRYKDGGPKQMGVMAQDVAKKHPAALGPEVDGFKTVDYGRL